MDRDQTKSAGKNATQTGGSNEQTASATSSDPKVAAGPTDAEIESWAEQVRQRRQAWLDGPTEEEKHEWFQRERMRRLALMGDEDEGSFTPRGHNGHDLYDDARRIQRRYIREMRLATEGLAVMMVTMPFRVMAELVATGREWEKQSLHPARRRWIPFYDEDL
jgi:hypothetical protein